MWLWGSAFGAIFGVLAILVGDVLSQAVIRQTVLQGPPVNVDATMQLVGMLELTIFLLCVVLASFLAGVLSKRFLSGLIAGVLFVLVTSVLGLLQSLIALGRIPSAQGLLQGAPQTLFATAVLVLLGAGLGAGCGTIGAVIGRAWARRTQAPTS
jgi:hypothetical protein